MLVNTAVNDRAIKHMKEKLIKLKGEMEIPQIVKITLISE